MRKLIGATIFLSPFVAMFYMMGSFAATLAAIGVFIVTNAVMFVGLILFYG